MTADRKKPGVAFWATVVVVVVLIGYPVSIGPAAWLNDHWEIQGWAYLALNRFYLPLDWVARNAPGPIPDILFWYADLWGSWLWGVQL
jgi:hypothetical protein